jgi:predicted membrane protein
MSSGALLVAAILLILVTIVFIITTILLGIYGSEKTSKWIAVTLLVLQVVSFLLVLGALIAYLVSTFDTKPVYLRESPEDRLIMVMVPKTCPTTFREQYFKEQRLGHDRYVKMKEQERLSDGQLQKDPSGNLTLPLGHSLECPTPGSVLKMV